jgi:aspartate-semialdehyde dehydrogenase
VTHEDILAAWADFRPLKLQHLPMAPEQPIEFAPQPDRPQPRLDRNRGRGMAVTVGRLRPCTVFDWKFTVLSHNTIRGAAGAAILNAELLRSLGKLDPAAPSDRSGSLERKKIIETVDSVIQGLSAAL